VATVQLFALVVGLIGALTMLIGAHAWGIVWREPSATSLTQLLSIQVLAASLAGVQMALLRAEQRPVADASTQTGSVLLGLLVGLFVVLWFRTATALVAYPIVAASSSFVLAICIRRKRFRWARPAEGRELVKFNSRISVQNLSFFVLASLPMWVVSTSAGAAEVGFFSRAVLIPGMASFAMATALTRALQPYYRHLESAAERQRGVSDAVTVTLAIALPLFGGLAALAPQVVGLWLGPGWERTSALLPPIAIAFGFYVVFTLLANAAELYAKYSAVNYAQLIMLPIAFGWAAITWATGQTAWAAFILLVTTLPGLLFLAFQTERAGISDLWTRRRSLAAQVLVSSLPAVAAWLAANLAGVFLHQSLFLELGIGTLIGGAVFFVSLPRQPAVIILKRRGIWFPSARQTRRR
jgi:O-antigen/teichoic acid export membrane protein